MTVSLETSPKNGGFHLPRLGIALGRLRVVQHGGPRGPQDGPRWPQDGLQEGSRRSTMTSKTVPKRPRGFETSKSGPGRPKRTFKWPPRSLKTIPRIPQDCPNIAPERVSISMMLGPSRLQNDLRGSPDALRCIQKETPRGPGGTHMQMKHALIKGKLSGMR